jgi:hypothetical protein
MKRYLDLNALAAKKSFFLLGNIPRKMDGIEILPFKIFLQALRQGEYE